jgi:ABC-2 type transport system ATP-binding protein
VQATCDRVLIIREGSLIYNASIEALKNHSRELSITVALKQPPEIDQLNNIDQVDLVEVIDEHRFRLYFNGSSPAESVVRASVEQQWGLYELIPDHASLEDLFIELTNDSAAAAGKQEVRP